jgi:transposase-like protein
MFQVVEKVTMCVSSYQSVAALEYDSILGQHQNGDIVLLWRVLGKGFEIRRLIYTTNSVEGYHRQLRKVTKSKSIFPTPEAAHKLLFLANRDILKKWTMPIQN